MSWGAPLTMVDFFTHPFMVRALVVGTLLSALSGYYGVFVVQRKMSFLGAGLGHAAFGGIALGLFLGVQPLWVALPFTVLVAIGISWIRRQTLLSSDTVIGIFFSVSVALGILLLSLKSGRSVDAFSYLFGSILAIDTLDIAATITLSAIAIASSLSLWGPWAYATFDPEAAKLEGIHTGRHDMMLTSLIALTIVVAIKVVGVLLVAAWIVVPAATARLISTSFRGMTLVSMGVSILATLVGLMGSWMLDLPSGALIVLVQILIFVPSVIYQSAKR